MSPKFTQKREKRAEKEERERGREKKKTKHSYVFISPTLEIVFERQKTKSVPNWPIRLGRIDAEEWSTAASFEPVLINPGIYSNAIYSWIYPQLHGEKGGDP